MNYCSIQDAWGNCNRYSKQYKNYMNDTEEDSPAPKCNKKDKCYINNIENFGNDNDTENVIDKKLEDHSINYDEHMDELADCDKFLVHIKNCRQCNQKMRNYFKPQILENFQDLIENNKDTIVLILIGISILLIFNMIKNLTK